jgi:pimeloyl-[acyl-carrier protein] methyl ester esterase
MNKSIYFKTLGKGQPLILLHGWGWNSEIWEPLLPSLSQYFQLVLIDLPGFGQSHLGLKEYSLPEIARLLMAIAPAKAYWLGWSLGGTVAWWIAINYPEKVEKLITVAASPRFTQDVEWPGVADNVLQKFAESLTHNYEKTISDFLELQLRGSPQREILFRTLQKKLLSHPPAYEALQGGLTLLQHTDLRAQLSAVQCPSLHLFGDLDRLVPVKVASLMQGLEKQGKCEVIQKSGHLPFLSQPEIFTEYLIQFLA